MLTEEENDCKLNEKLQQMTEESIHVYGISETQEIRVKCIFQTTVV